MRLDSEQYQDRFIYHWGMWEPDETHVINNLLKPGETFLDIGANAGYYSLLASGIVGETGHVHAVEPVPSTAEKLRENLRLNNINNVTVHQYAALESRKIVKIAKRGIGDVSGQNSLRFSGQDRDYWEVPGVRLDQLINTKIHLIKMDIEGAEVMALKGMAKLLAGDDAPPILCEVTDSFFKELGSSAEELYRILADFGYAFPYDCHDQKLRPIDIGSDHTAVFQRNVVFSKTRINL